MLLCSLVAPASARADAKGRAFERVFKSSAQLDPARIAEAKAAKPGEYVLVDADGDGKNDEAWFIDPSPRHRAAARPLLVRAIDEDGDLDADKGPDLDSDLYVADWKADGTVDAVVDYQDDDRDGDVDQMGIYYWSPKDHFLGRDALRVWWGRDDGDDNQLWYDVDYTYDQALCQWRCHFSGDETFVAFGLTEDSAHWVSIWENPFLFYDPDGDTCSEEVIRFSGLADQVEALRWSFDADNDAHGRRTHDYDFSITAIAPGSRWLTDGRTAASDLTIPAELTEKTTLRGIPTGGWLRRDRARDFARTATWAKAVLTWDEINANTDGDVQRDPHERWEGVIARASKNFPQVGGPPVSAFNKRNEVCAKLIDKLELYLDETDHRMHLKGATEAWLDVDYNLDGKLDAKYEWFDDDRDGYFDRRTIDADADGKVDFDWKMQGKAAVAVPLEMPAIQSRCQATLTRVLEESQSFIDAATPRLTGKMEHSLSGDVRSFFASKLESYAPETRLGAYIRRSPAGARFYVELLRDRQLYALHDRMEPARWNALVSLCGQGRYRTAAQLLSDAPAPGFPWLRDYPRRLPLSVRVAGTGARENVPVSIQVSAIRRIAADFNPADCGLTAPEPWIAPRELPHQVDGGVSSGDEVLSFSADAPRGGLAVYHLFYMPERYLEPRTGRPPAVQRTPTTFPARTATARDWVPPNIGWESDRVGYREYYGQFDFFGKSASTLIYPAIGKQSYHDETPWGIDALSTAKTSGCGGLTLYLDGKAYPVQNPVNVGNVKFVKRFLAQGPVRCAVEIQASNIVPGRPDITVTIRPTIYAGRQESQIDVTVTGVDDEVEIAPGLIRLQREKAFAEPGRGFFGNWGWQMPGIGEIGMGVIGPPGQFRGVVDLPDERQYKWQTSDRQLRYWIIADWRRGRQYPVAPTGDNWKAELAALAKELLTPVAIEVGPGQEVGAN